MKIKYRAVFNRKNKLDSFGYSLIQIECYLRPNKAYFSTGIKISPSQWNGLIVNHPNACELNAYIIECITKLESIEMDLWKHGVTPTLEHLRKGWKSNSKLTDFGSFANGIILNSDRRPRTKDNLLYTVKTVNDFRKTDIGDIDYAYLKEYEQWCRHRGVHENTISKQMSNIQTIMNEAMRCGVIKENPFVIYQKPKTIQSPHVTLSETELKQISKVNIHTNVRDAFIFCCNTGLRYGDYVNLHNAQWTVNKNKKWLTVTTEKTGVTVRLPLHLLGEYPHPEIGSNADTNRKLKEIVEKAKIKKRVTFHTARHTFATILLNKGVDIVSVQKLLGHTSVRMTQRYAEVKDKKIEHDLKKALRVEIK